jgi:hypothetical protein
MASNTDNIKLAFSIAGAQEVSNAFKAISHQSTALGAAVAGIGVVTGALAGFGAAAMHAAAAEQMLATKFNAVFGKGTGDQALQWVKSIATGAAGAVYSVEEIADAVLKLRALGLNPGKMLIPMMETGAATGGSIEAMAGIFGKLQQMGTVSMRQVLGLIKEGIPAGDILNEVLGTSVKQLKGMGEAGMSAKVFIDAMMTGLTKKFGGTMAEMGKNWIGMVNIFKRRWGEMLDTIGAPLLQAVMPIFEKISKWFTAPETTTKILQWASYIIAGVKTVAGIVESFLNFLFDSNSDKPKWVYQMEEGFWKILAIAIAIKGAMMTIATIKIAMLSPNPWAIAAALGAVPAEVAATAIATALAMGKATEAKNAAKGAKGMSFQGMAQDFAGNQAEILNGMLGNLPKFGNAKAPGGMAPGVLGGAAAVGSEIGKAVQKFIVGGGSQAGAWSRMLDLPGGNRAASNVIPVKFSEQSGDQFKKFLAQAVSDAFADILKSPRGKQAVKAAVATAQ